MNAIEVSELGQWFEREAAALALYGRHWLDQATSEDVVQEVFIALLLQQARPENVKAWLYRAVRNAALKQLRTQTRRLRREESFADTTPAWFQTDPGLDLDAQQAERALRELPDDEREIVTLRIWGGLTLDEIASVVGASVATVFRRYRSALESLRHEMNVLCHSRIN